MEKLNYICAIDSFEGFPQSDNGITVLNAKKLKDYPILDTSMDIVISNLIFHKNSGFEHLTKQLLDMYPPQKTVLFLTMNGAFSTSLTHLRNIVNSGNFCLETTKNQMQPNKIIDGEKCSDSLESCMGSMYLEGEGGFSKYRYSFSDLIRIIKRLTAPDGCEWDKVQTHDSIVPNLIEEAYEAAAAIMTKSVEDMREEFGDCLLQTVLNCDIAERSGEFTLSDCIDTLCKKLINRHTHIFGSDNASDAAEALVFWEKAKEKEKNYSGAIARLSKLPKNLPALMLAQKTVKAIMTELPITKETLTTQIIQRLQNTELESNKILLLTTALYSLNGNDAETVLMRDIQKLTKDFSDNNFTSFIQLIDKN